MKKLITLALAALSLTACAKQPKDMYETDEFQTKSGQTDVTGIPAQLPDIDVRIRHYE